MKIYLAGCGKIGTRLGEQLTPIHEVIGLKRRPADFAFPVRGIDLNDKQALEQLPLDADVIVFTVTPSRYDEAGYRQVYDTILGHVIDWAEGHQKPPLMLLVSSTSVYGQQHGEWVDETSETIPDRATSGWILFGEKQLRQRLENTLTVRFSGIYGNGRNRLIKKVKMREPIQQQPPIWTNRIHEDDCIGILVFLIKQYQQGRVLDKIYLASDDMPVSQYEVCSFIAEQRMVPAPPVQIDNLTDKLNKRCRNSRLKALGYRLKYPDYRFGYML